MFFSWGHLMSRYSAASQICIIETLPINLNTAYCIFELLSINRTISNQFFMLFTDFVNENVNICCFSDTINWITVATMDLFSSWIHLLIILSVKQTRKWEKCETRKWEKCEKFPLSLNCLFCPTNSAKDI